jgi:hypothetical protein
LAGYFFSQQETPRSREKTTATAGSLCRGGHGTIKQFVSPEMVPSAAETARYGAFSTLRPSWKNVTTGRSGNNRYLLRRSPSLRRRYVLLCNGDLICLPFLADPVHGGLNNTQFDVDKATSAIDAMTANASR